MPAPNREASHTGKSERVTVTPYRTPLTSALNGYDAALAVSFLSFFVDAPFLSDLSVVDAADK